MTSVEVVKAMCKEHRVPIYKLEKDLGFANGYISQLRKGVFPTDRAILIARYFNVPLECITGEAEQKEKPLTDEGEELAYSDMELLAAIRKADAKDIKAIRVILGIE